MSHRHLLVVALALGLAACSTAPQTLPGIDRLGTPGRTWGTWMDGGPTPDALRTFTAHSTDPVGRFGAGEAAFMLGRYEDAWDLHAEVVAQHPDHPLARWSALRLLELRANTPGIGSRTAYLVSRLRQPASDDAATAVLVALLASSSQAQRTQPPALSVWRTAGPYGNHPIGDLNRTFPPDERATIVREPASSLTELVQVRMLRDDEADPSLLRLPARGPGTYYQEAEFATNRAGRWVLHLELPHDTKVLLDGVELVRRDILDTSAPEQLLVELDLGAGLHRLRLRTAWTGERAHWRAQLVPLESQLTAEDHLKPGPGASAIEATSGARVRHVGSFLAALPVMAGVKAGRDPLAAYLRARWSVEFAPADTADEAVARLREIAPKFVGTALVSGRAAQRLGELRYLDPAAAQIRGLEAYTRGVQRHPDANALALQQARGLLASGRWGDGVDIATRLVRGRDDLSALLLLADAYTARGWWQEALPTLARAQDLAPRSCAVASRWLAVRTRLGDLPDASEDLIADLPTSCRAVGQIIAESFPADESGSSPAELALIALLRADPYDSRRRVDLARQRWTTGRVDDALETLGRGAEANPWDVQVHMARADLLRSVGRADEALEVLDRALTATPGDLRLLRARAWVDGRLFMADAREPVTDEDLAALPTDTTTVALDRRHVRVHRDGATTTLFHRVVRVASRADAEEAGAVSVPDDAIVLAVRTRKANGRTLDARPAASRLLLQSLEPGDTVEVEYLVHASPRSNGDRFWPVVHVFGDPRWTTARAVLSIEFPTQIEHTIATSAACCNRETLARGAATTLRTWQMDGLPPQRAERDSPDASVWAPYVAITVGDEIEEYRRALAGLTAISTRRTRRIERLVATIRPEIGGQEAWARSIFNWVTHQVPRRTTDLSTPASSMLAAGSGSPAVLTAALLRVAGIQADVALVQSQPSASEPSPESFTSAVVRCVLDGQEVWLDPSLTYMPFAYLPPRLQNASALVLGLAPSPGRATTPTGNPDDERRDIVETLSFDLAGNIVGEARLELRGETAAVVREQLAARPGEPSRRQIAETIASAEFPSSKVTRYEITRTEERGVPLVVQFRFEQPFRGRREPSRLQMTHSLAPQQLTPRYGLGDRLTPLLLSQVRRSRARVTVIPPRGWQVSTPMTTRDINTRFGSLSRRIEPRGGRLEVEDGFALIPQLVELSALADFRAFAAAVDESSLLQIELRRVEP